MLSSGRIFWDALFGMPSSRCLLLIGFFGIPSHWNCFFRMPSLQFFHCDAFFWMHCLVHLLWDFLFLNALFEMRSLGCVLWLEWLLWMPSLECLLWDAIFIIPSLVFLIWDAFFGMPSLGCLLWDAFFGMSSLGCILWNASFWMSSLGFLTLKCLLQDVSFGIPFLKFLLHDAFWMASSEWLFLGCLFQDEPQSYLTSVSKFLATLALHTCLCPIWVTYLIV